MKFISIWVLLIFASCTKKDILKIDDERKIVNIDPKNFEISEMKVQEWKLGENKNEIRSKGLEVFLDLPVFSKNDVKYLAENFQINSWLVQLSKKVQGSFRPVGAITVEIQRKHNKKMVDDIWFTIRYISATVRADYVDYICPPFAHNKSITKFKTSHFPELTTNLTVSGVNDRPYKEKTLQKTFNSNDLQAGHFLEGEYTIDLALYDSLNKRLKSNLFRLPYRINIEEQSREIPGCSQYKDIDGLIRNQGKKFQWKKDKIFN